MNKPVVYNYKTAEDKISRLKQLVRIMGETVKGLNDENKRLKEKITLVQVENNRLEYLTKRPDPILVQAGCFMSKDHIERLRAELKKEYENIIVLPAEVKVISGAWIPITEREPDTAEHVLVTIKWAEDDFEVCEIDYGVMKHAEGPYAENIIKHVIAWRPLPEPYKGE